MKPSNYRDGSLDNPEIVGDKATCVGASNEDSREARKDGGCIVDLAGQEDAKQAFSPLGYILPAEQTFALAAATLADGQ